MENHRYSKRKGAFIATHRPAHSCPEGIPKGKKGRFLDPVSPTSVRSGPETLESPEHPEGCPSILLLTLCFRKDLEEQVHACSLPPPPLHQSWPSWQVGWLLRVVMRGNDFLGEGPAQLLWVLVTARPSKGLKCSVGTFSLQGQLLALQWPFLQGHSRVGVLRGFSVVFVVQSVFSSLLPGTV